MSDFIFGALLLLYGATVFAMIGFLVVSDIQNSKRTACRCCNARLPRPGGVGLMWVGSGFCKRCAAGILRPRSLK